MTEIEKRELFEQQRKIFEAEAQRVDKRAGSFSFLTWPFFIAPLIAGEEFLAATFNSAAAEEDAKAARQARRSRLKMAIRRLMIPRKRAQKMRRPRGPPRRRRRMRSSSIRPGFWRSRRKTRPSRAPPAAKAKLSPPQRVGAGAAAAAMMPIRTLMTLASQWTIVLPTRCQRIPTSEAVNRRVGQRSNPFSPMYLATPSARRSSALLADLEASAIRAMTWPA